MKKSSVLIKKWEKELENLDRQQLNRKLHLPRGLDFSSNDYLSLASHSGIRKLLIQALKKNLPLSSGASRLIRGHTNWHETTEKLFQKWIDYPALFFGSGYLANLGLISTLCKDSVLFSDQMNHASLIDGCRLSRSPCHIYAHKNMNELETLLKKEKRKNKVIITESLFSMDGDFAPLEELSNLALKYQALLIVDEAHATGIYGLNGKGLCSLLKNRDHIISVHPCGKALSASGAFVVSTESIKKYLINKCRSFVYTTASSPIVLFHIQCVIDLLMSNAERRELLKKKADFFREQVKKFANIGDSESVIVPIITGSTASALLLEKKLQKKGYDIRAIRYPTVPKGKERLRICIHYNHTYKQLKQLVFDLKQILKVK